MPSAIATRAFGPPTMIKLYQRPSDIPTILHALRVLRRFDRVKPEHRALMSVSCRGTRVKGREVRPGLCPGPAKGGALGTRLGVVAPTASTSLPRLPWLPP